MNDGGPAFPTEKWECVETIPGMSLRDWFAGQAVIGLLAFSPDAVGKCPTVPPLNKRTCRPTP